MDDLEVRLKKCEELVKFHEYINSVLLPQVGVMRRQVAQLEAHYKAALVDLEWYRAREIFLKEPRGFNL